MTIDLDELERLAKASGTATWSASDNDDASLQYAAAICTAGTALIARARRADELEKENAWLQEAGTVLARRVTGLDDAMFHYDPPLDDD
jgi:hypothetical protein